MYLYGKNSIQERLKINPKSIKRIFLQQNFDTTEIISLIDSKSIPVKRVTEKHLSQIKRADRLQGIVAEVEDFKYTEFDKLLEDSTDGPLSIICLDNISDPHNLGSILRIAACFGGFACVVPRHRACEVNDTVMHVASGGENFVPVSMVINMSTALEKAKKKGYWIVGTVVDRGEDINKTSLPFPLCLVLGSEGKGIRHGVEKNLDLRVTLPMKGAALSLNVAMTAACFCGEISRQKSKS